MTARRDPDAILAAWMEEGPDVLPESTRRAIEVTTRTTHQSRRLTWLPWRASNMNEVTRLALAAAAVMAVVVGGLYVLRPGTDRPGGVGGPGSPTMTQPYTSTTHGFSVRYPADWRAESSTDGFDTFEPATGEGGFRGASAVVPDGAVVDDWISQNITYADKAGCDLPRGTLEQVTIDGQPGRLRGWCGDPPAMEIEATVVVNNRVYIFTLFRGSREGSSEADERALFDAFTETITLNPQDAEGSPGPSPS